MQNYLNINLIKTSENVSPALNPLLSLKDVPLPSTSFNNVLLEQLNTAKNIHIEFAASDENTVKRAEEWAKHPEKNNYDKPLPEKLETNYANDKASGTDDKGFNKDNMPPGGNNSLKADDSAGRKDKIENTEDKINNIRADKANDKNTVTKEEKPRTDELSFLQKELASLLNMLNGIAGKKQLQDIKSTLLEIKDLLKSVRTGSGNMFQGKSAIASMNGQIRDLMEKLEDLFAKDARAAKNDAKKRIIPVNEKDKNIENRAGIPETSDLKKQIIKLTEEIKQILNDKKQMAFSDKNSDISENKNVTQKIYSENIKADKNEGAQPKENGQNFNFSFQKKETEGTVFNKAANAYGAGKNSAFSEQLNEIAQNAKVFMRDGDNGTFSIKLHPESLGRVNVNLSLENGVITGKFLVENTDAREALLENMNSVKEDLQQNGISVGEFHVNVRGEKNPYGGLENAVPHAVKNIPETIGSIYEINSIYSHDGEIDYLI